MEGGMRIEVEQKKKPKKKNQKKTQKTNYERYSIQ